MGDVVSVAPLVPGVRAAVQRHHPRPSRSQRPATASQRATRASPAKATLTIESVQREVPSARQASCTAASRRRHREASACPAGRGRPVEMTGSRLALPRGLHRFVFRAGPGRRPVPPLRDHRIFVDVTGRSVGGFFPANVAWLACAVIRHSLPRRWGRGRPTQAPGPVSPHPPRPDRRGATFTWHGAGHITLHLPEGWHRERQWMNLFRCRLRAAPAPA